MKTKFYLFLVLCINLSIQAQSVEETISQMESQLTDGGAQSWEFYQKVETMGSRKFNSSQCSGGILRFDANKSFMGKLCELGIENEGNWSLVGDDPYEIYLNIGGEKLMIDIYMKKIGEEREQVLRLKKLSNNKVIPSIAYIFRKSK